MEDGDYERRMTYYVGGDLAIGEKKVNAHSCFVVGGVDADNMLHIIDVRHGRWDGPDIIEEMFNLHERYNPEVFRVEEENIERAIGGFLYDEMDRRGEYINLDTKVPTKDKDQRATAIATMMKAGRVKFDKAAEWYPDFEEEVASFPKAVTKDRVDAFAWLGMLIRELVGAPTREQEEEQEYENQLFDYFDWGRSEVTGY